MAEPKIRFRRDDGSSYPAWNNKCFGDLFKKNNERNGDQFSEDRTISIASMSFSPNGNGADANSLSAYKVLRVGDVAFEGHENKEFSHGRFVMNDIGDGIMSPRFSCMRPITPIINGFWKYYIHSEAVMRDILIRSTKKGTMMHELVFDDFFKQSIDVPCLEEQQKIADFLSAVDEVITASEAEVANLETQKKALMKKIFSQEVRFKREDGSDFPEWKERKLGDLGKATGGVGFPEKYQGYKDLQVPFYKVSDMNLPGNEISMSLANNYVSDELLRQMKSKPFVDTAVIFAKVGAAVFLDRKRIAYPPFLVDNNMMVFTPSCNDIDFQFLYHWFVSIKLSTFAQTGALPSYNASDIETINVCYPCLKEQRLIADFLSDFDEAIAAAKKELELWKELKKGLLRQMFV